MACLTSPFPIPAQPAAAPTTPARPLALAAACWKTFPISRIAPHGCKVRRGEELLRIDTTRLDRRISLLKRIVLRNGQRLAAQQKELNEWRTKSAHQLEALLETAVSARETELYFRTHLRREKKAIATQAIERTGLMLANQIQEYRMIFGLEKVKRSATSLSSRAIVNHQGVMAAAEFCLGMEVLNHRKIIENQLPQEARTLAGAAEDARRRYVAALEVHAQRSFSSQLSFTRREHRLARQCEALAALETDRSICVLHAPADGWFHHISAAYTPATATLATGDHLTPGQIFAQFTPQIGIAFGTSPE